MTLLAVITFFRNAWATIKASWPAILLGLVLALLIACMLVLSKCRDNTAEQVDQQTIKVQGDIGDANTNSSAARVEDAVTAEKQTQELDHAIENTTTDDARRRARGCAILRQQAGGDPARVPAVCRP